MLTGVTKMNQKISVRLVLPVVLVVGAIFLLMVTDGLDGERLHIFRQTQLTTTHTSITASSPRRRYSTSDEMQYILYGVGDQFSPYDQQLIDYIRSHISVPSLTRPRQLATPQKEHASQSGQSAFIDKFLSGRQHGFFIECGAADGESSSNSLFFELKRNWTGLLIEANPGYHRALLNKNRRAYVLKACLSPERRPATVNMIPFGLSGGIANKMPHSHRAFLGNRKQISVNCFPLNAIMVALDISHVDYLSLDVEGPELEILRTIDWTRLHIDVITVEYRVTGKWLDTSATLKKLKDLREFFANTSIYREVAWLPDGKSEANARDIVFSHV